MARFFRAGHYRHERSTLIYVVQTTGIAMVGMADSTTGVAMALHSMHAQVIIMPWQHQ